MGRNGYGPKWPGIIGYYGCWSFRDLPFRDPYTFGFRDLTCSRPTLSRPDIFATCTFRYPDFLSLNNRYMKEVILIFILYFIYLNIFTIYI